MNINKKLEFEHSEKLFSYFFQIEKNMIVAIVFVMIMSKAVFLLFHNQKENCHYDHVLFNLKIIWNQYLLSAVLYNDLEEDSYKGII